MAYRKFSDVVRENPIYREPERAQALAGLATLARAHTEDRISAKSDGQLPADGPSTVGNVVEIGGTSAVAKVAKVAKDAWSAADDGTSRRDPTEGQDRGRAPLPEPRLIAPAPWF
jgi:hypothetical protein